MRVWGVGVPVDYCVAAGAESGGDEVQGAGYRGVRGAGAVVGEEGEGEGGAGAGVEV